MLENYLNVKCFYCYDDYWGSGGMEREGGGRQNEFTHLMSLR